MPVVFKYFLSVGRVRHLHVSTRFHLSPAPVRIPCADIHSAEGLSRGADLGPSAYSFPCKKECPP